MALIYFVQLNFFWFDDEKPFFWWEILLTQFFTFYLYGVLMTLVVFLAKKFKVRRWNSPNVLLHILFAIALSLIYLLVSLYNNTFIFIYGDVSFVDLYRYSVETNSHVTIVAYWAVVGATNAYEYLDWYKAAEGERVVLLGELEKIRSEEYIKKLQVKERGLFVSVSLDDICWIEAFDNYIKLHSEGRFYLMRKTLSSIEKELDPRKFCRIHRSFVVNVDEIRSLKKLKNGDGILMLKGEKELRVSRNYRDQLESHYS